MQEESHHSLRIVGRDAGPGKPCQSINTLVMHICICYDKERTYPGNTERVLWRTPCSLSRL